MERSEGGPWSSRWARWGLWFAVWTLLGLFDAAQSYLRYRFEKNPVTWLQALEMGLALWYAWAVLAVFVYRLARRYPFEQGHWLTRLPLHLAAGAFFAGVKLVMDYPIIEAFYCPEPGLMPFDRFYAMAFASHFHTYVLIYWAMLGVFHALNYYRKYQERDLRTAQLETRLAHAQLQCLRMQLHPHFLFNTLHAISALIPRDTDVAERMLARLGDLLRLTLDHAGSHEVALRQELEFVQAYLEIEQVRFGDRLQVRTHIDPQTLDASVPYLILQPLVENSIRHGLQANGHRGLVEISARNVSGTLRLQVRDNGPGLTKVPSARRGKGIGLANTRERLQQLYGDDHFFEICNDSAGGAVVTIEVPYRESPSVAGLSKREVAVEGS